MGFELPQWPGAAPRRAALALGFGSALALCAGACTAEHFERDADRAVAALLEDGTERTLGDRERTVQRPERRAPEPEPAPNVPTTTEPRPVERLTLAGALETAVSSNRSLLARKDQLYQTALGLTGTRHAFSPRISAALNHLFAGSDVGAETHSTSLGVGVSKTLPWGGELRLDGNSDFDSANDGTYGSGVSIRLTQPLLRGAGSEVALEALTQAERELVYAIREFELFREEFSIDVARRFYDLVQQKQAVDNQRRNLETFTFGRKQAEALFSVGRTSELEVLRARRSELTSQNSLIEAEEGLRLSLDRFRIFLGLPDDHPVDVMDEEPAWVEVDFDSGSAVAVALANRLDWLNARERLEDAERGVRLAKDGLLPDVSLALAYSRAGAPAASFGTQDLDDESYSAGLSLEIPVQRVDERNRYRSAQLSLANARRAIAEFEDELVVSVQSTFRELERRKQSLDIQAQLIVDQEKNVKIAQLRFEQGNFSNRDVVEAQQALLEAQNALIREKVSYEIARLQLLKDLGILFIDEKGMWKE